METVDKIKLFGFLFLFFFSLWLQFVKVFVTWFRSHLEVKHFSEYKERSIWAQWTYADCQDIYYKWAVSFAIHIAALLEQSKIFMKA